MGQNNSELISKITRQFASQITPGFLRTLSFTSGYFNTGRPLYVENTVIQANDPSFLNRILDSVVVDTETRTQFYDAVMRSQDPIYEMLLPLIDAIAEKIMVSDRTNLNPTIRADFKKYAGIRSLISDEKFHDVMLRAIASACLANLVDFMTRKTKSLMATQSEDDQLKARELNQAFMSKIVIPFDGYLSSLTAKKFKEDLVSMPSISSLQPQDGVQQDRHWFVAMVLRAFQNLIHLFSGQGNRPQHAVSSEYDADVEKVAMSSEIEPRVRALSSVADKVVATLKSHAPETKLLKNVETFAENLFGLIEEINDKRTAKTDFEISATRGFENLCEGFSTRLKAQIQEYGIEEDPDEVLRIVNELTEHVSPGRSTTPDNGLDGSCDDEMIDGGGSRFRV